MPSKSRYLLTCGNFLEIDIDDVTLNINTAILCGLIIVELVSSVLNYAFPKRMTGIINVALHYEFKNRFALTIKDNGIGYPSNFQFKNVKYLGLQLVTALTNQTEGALELDYSSVPELRLTS